MRAIGGPSTRDILMEFAQQGEIFGVDEALAFIAARKPDATRGAVRGYIADATFYGMLERVSIGRYRLKERAA